MLYLNKGQENTLVLNINNNTRETFSGYTLVFTHIMSKDIKSYSISTSNPSEFFQNIRYCSITLDLTNNDLWVDYITIWEDLTNIFSFESHEIKRIIKKWAQETYHLDRPNPMGIKRRDNKYVVENIE